MKDKNLSVQLPIDNLSKIWPKDFRGAKLGALLHPASISSSLRHSLSVLKEHNGSLFQLAKLFGPQHGFQGQTQDNMIEWEGFPHPQLGIPIYSLYGEHRKPTREMLSGLDILLVDLQDVGARYYTFIWSLFLCMEACEPLNIPVVVLDRPNPINGITEEGDVLNPEYRSFVGLHSIKPRHGKTIGQLAQQFKTEAFPNCNLTVLNMEGWDPSMWFDQTGLPWVLPSPNMPTLDTATVYPGMCLFEATNISEARGTTRPFELVGAPFIQGKDFQEKLNRLDLPGVYFREAYFQPTFHKFSGEVCQGVQIHVKNRDAFLPLHTAMEILRVIQEDYPGKFKWKEPPYEYEYEKLPIEILLGGPLSNYFNNVNI